MKDKSSFVGAVSGAAACLIAQYFATFVAEDYKALVGFLFGGLFAMFVVWYHTRD